MRSPRVGAAEAAWLGEADSAAPREMSESYIMTSTKPGKRISAEALPLDK